MTEVLVASQQDIASIDQAGIRAKKINLKETTITQLVMDYINTGKLRSPTNRPLQLVADVSTCPPFSRQLRRPWCTGIQSAFDGARCLDDSLPGEKRLKDISTQLNKGAATEASDVETVKEFPIGAATTCMLLLSPALGRKSVATKAGLEGMGTLKQEPALENDGMEVLRGPIVKGAAVAATPSFLGTGAQTIRVAREEETKTITLHLKHMPLSTLTKDVGELVLLRYEKLVDRFCHDAVCYKLGYQTSEH